VICPCKGVKLTYMSIPAKIAALEAAGKLMRYSPRSRHPPRRRLYLTEAAIKDLTDQDSAVNILVGRGFIEASMARWVSGQLVYGDTRGRFLHRLTAPPPEIWEIRVTEPVVQARLLGRFAEADTLILSKFYTRQLLETYWTTAMGECEHSWNSLFDPLAPFTGKTIHDYVTENCDDFPI
jgi:hypothetical protein